MPNILIPHVVEKITAVLNRLGVEANDQRAFLNLLSSAVSEQNFWAFSHDVNRASNDREIHLALKQLLLCFSNPASALVGYHLTAPSLEIFMQLMVGGNHQAAPSAPLLIVKKKSFNQSSIKYASYLVSVLKDWLNQTYGTNCACEVQDHRAPVCAIRVSLNIFQTSEARDQFLDYINTFSNNLARADGINCVYIGWERAMRMMADLMSRKLIGDEWHGEFQPARLISACQTQYLVHTFAEFVVSASDHGYGASASAPQL